MTRLLLCMVVIAVLLAGCNSDEVCPHGSVEDSQGRCVLVEAPPQDTSGSGEGDSSEPADTHQPDQVDTSADDEHSSDA